MTTRSIEADSPGPPWCTRFALALAAALRAFGALLFIPAGRLDWVAGWLYFGIAVINVTINYGAGLILRTSLEDRALCQELAGYAQYAQRVRYRLIPGLW